MIGWIFFFILLLGLGLGIPIVIILMNNIQVILRYRTNSFDLVKNARGRIKKDSNNVDFFKVFLQKIELKSPPPEAISLTKGGNKLVEIEVSEEGSARYIIKDKDTGNFKSLNTNDKLFIAQRTQAAKERKKVHWAEFAQSVAVGITLIILCLGTLVLLPNVLDKFTTLVDKQDAIISKADQILQRSNQQLVLTDPDVRNGQVILNNEDGRPPE